MSTNKLKIVSDNIYGYIELSELAVKIIDTPQFQRLRNLRQLGNTHLVFPGANHTRFEHSLGVYHLAGVYINALLKNSKSMVVDNKFDNIGQENVHIAPRTIELIKIAGLVHDLGHAAFSHLFDHHIAPEHKLESHEIRSNHIMKTISHGLSHEELEFINSIVCGKPTKNYAPWIFQIISNSDFQFDVDKLDYIVRDCYYTQLKHTLQIDRIFQHAKIINGYICFDSKIQIQIFDVFMCRYRLHLEVYRHRVVVGYDLIVLEMLKEIINHLKLNVYENWSLMNDNIIENIPLFFKDNVRLLDLYNKYKTRHIYEKSEYTVDAREVVYDVKLSLSSGFESPFKNIRFIKSGEICSISPNEMLKLFTNEFEERITYNYKLTY
jgi:HD superfamily phosphohydrolase